jgi:glucokinase
LIQPDPAPARTSPRLRRDGHVGISVGVDVGGTKILGVALRADAPVPEVTAEARVPTPDDTDTALDAVADVVRRLAPDGGPVGFGVAGLVDRRGVLQASPHVRALRGVDVFGEMRARLGERVVWVDNDATGATWAEHVAGAARGADDAVFVQLGTGIGSGLIANGALVRGPRGFGGEAGHMVVDPTGPPCSCGRRGCWERFASGSGLARLGRDAAEAGRLGRAVALAGGEPHLVKGEHIARAASEGDDDALEVLHAFARWVALGIGNLVTIFGCSLVVVGGGLVQMGDLLLEPVRQAFRWDVMAPAQRLDVRIVGAELGERAAAIGAGLLAAKPRPGA